LLRRFARSHPRVRLDLRIGRSKVVSGIAVTTRTARFLGPGMAPAPTHLDLPPLPVAEFSLRVRANAGKPATDLAALLADGLP
ncbi:hypothetical protein QN219_28150, partial [Sinorhizobium sp. 7-81]|nr:hypothetical protein [Sinorhizobium sp. 8-89]